MFLNAESGEQGKRNKCKMQLVKWRNKKKPRKEKKNHQHCAVLIIYNLTFQLSLQSNKKILREIIN
jgi:hypothetical protein